MTRRAEDETFWFCFNVCSASQVGVLSNSSTREAGLSLLFTLFNSAAQEYPLVPMLAGSSGGTRNGKRERERGSKMREKMRKLRREGGKRRELREGRRKELHEQRIKEQK